MLNPQYAEVTRVLGQSETDRQLGILGKALSEALPQLKDDPTFTTATDLWSRRQNNWPIEFTKSLQARNPPIHHQASIAALNNSYAVHVAQINKGREAHHSSLIKLSDETRSKVKQADVKIKS